MSRLLRSAEVETAVSHEEIVEWGGDGEGENAEWPEYPD
jgi:hypothetical protein